MWELSYQTEKVGRMRTTFTLALALLTANLGFGQQPGASPYNMSAPMPVYRSLAADSLDDPRPYQPQSMQQPQRVIQAQAPTMMPNLPNMPVQTLPAPGNMESMPAPTMQSVPGPVMMQGQQAPFMQECMTGSCQPNCEPKCRACGPPGRFWVRGEVLYWSVQGFDVPPLVSQSPDGTQRIDAGVLGTPGTNVVNGGDNFNSSLRPGYRINAGLWLDECQTIGIEGGLFMLQDESDTARFGSPGTPIFSRPFINAGTGFRQDAELVSFPGVLSGGVDVKSNSSLAGGNINAIHNLCCNCNYRVDLLYGYRYMKLSEEVTITEDLLVTEVGGPAPLGTRILVQDTFKTENDFHGGMIGMSTEYWMGKVFLGARGGVSLGNTRSVVEINGRTVTTTPGGVSTEARNGLLAQNTNIGRYEESRFSVLPEGGFRLGLQMTNNIRLFAGYDFMYWTNVVRPGDQIDNNVNPTQIFPGTLVGPARPVFTGSTSNVWVQGGSLGLELRY